MFRRLLILSMLAVAGQASAAEAGKVIFTAGSVSIAERPGAEGAAVNEGELLTTGDDGFLYIKTVDNGLFILRPKTKARIVAYHVDTVNPANTKVKLELISGVARSKSGDAVKLARQNFRFNTPVAAIGVRGTDFSVFTDQDTSRVAVLTGGVVVSGFVGACRPEGGGPCEGAASRELSATQRGQLLQVKRGQQAPQLLQGGAASPDLVSPPRADEPVAKNGGVATEPTLDPKKSNSFDKLVQAPPTPTPPPVDTTTPTPPSPVEPPVVVPPVVDNGGTPTPPPTEPTTPPTPVTPPAPELPERTLQWGRWAAVQGQPANAPLITPAGADSVMSGRFVVIRSAGKDYVLPERGGVAFTLKDSEAYIFNTSSTIEPLPAKVQNGQLSFDFGKATFATTFDLVAGSDVYKMMAEGEVAPDGRFGNTRYVRPQTNNTWVDGYLSNANNGSAAYVFERRIDDNRTANGVTYWGR